MSARCWSCGAPIAWVRTSAGKRMPIDVEPVPNGNVVIDNCGVAHVVSAKGGEAVGGTRHVSHFATCPKADQHRRR